MLYRPDGQHEGKLFSTGKHTIEVPVPSDGEYVVEVRAHSEGGDGEVAQIKISGEQNFFLPSNTPWKSWSKHFLLVHSPEMSATFMPKTGEAASSSEVTALIIMVYLKSS